MPNAPAFARTLLLLALACPAFAGDGRGATEPAAIAHLRIEPVDGEYLAWADNLLAGPIEVRLAATGAAPPGDPPLPARASVPAGGSALVARLRPASGSSGLLRLSLSGESVGSAAAASTSACLKSVTPLGDSAAGHAERLRS